MELSRIFKLFYFDPQNFKQQLLGGKLLENPKFQKYKNVLYVYELYKSSQHAKLQIFISMSDPQMTGIPKCEMW